MIKDTIQATGQLTVQLFGSNGQLKEQHSLKNLVVSVGLNFIAARLTGTPAVMSHMALGAGTAAAVLANSAVGSELGRVPLVSSAVSANTVTYAATFLPGAATGAVTESGIFNASAAGTMLCRTVFPVINKGVGDTLSVSWVVTIS